MYVITCCCQSIAKRVRWGWEVLDKIAVQKSSRSIDPWDAVRRCKALRWEDYGVSRGSNTWLRRHIIKQWSTNNDWRTMVWEQYKSVSLRVLEIQPHRHWLGAFILVRINTWHPVESKKLKTPVVPRGARQEPHQSQYSITCRQTITTRSLIPTLLSTIQLLFDVRTGSKTGFKTDYIQLCHSDNEFGGLKLRVRTIIH